MQTKRFDTFVIVIGLLISGCSTKLHVYEVQGNQSGACTECERGIPFRILEPHTVKLMAMTANGELRLLDKPLQVDLPDPRHLYTINYSAQYFSKTVVKLTFNEDGSLNKSELSASSTVPDAIKQLASTTKDVGTTAVDYENTRKAQEKKALDAEIDLLTKRKALIDAQKNLEKAQ